MPGKTILLVRLYEKTSARNVDPRAQSFARDLPCGGRQRVSDRHPASPAAVHGGGQDSPNAGARDCDLEREQASADKPNAVVVLTLAMADSRGRGHLALNPMARRRGRARSCQSAATTFNDDAMPLQMPWGTA